MYYFKRKKINRLKKKILHAVKHREQMDVKPADIAKEIALYIKLGAVYDKLRFKKKFPRAELMANECYRAAANLGDKEAQYILASRLFELGRFWSGLSESLFAAKVHKVYADQAYKEAMAYVEASEEQKHFLAKRLRGLAYINGWGVSVDQEKGFQLVVDSIEDEGAWDRATKIFEEIGLNKPEFFSTMMALRKK